MNANTIIHETVARHARELETLALRVHRQPELGYEEVKACAWQVQLLRRWQFRVRTPVAGMATAFRAESGSGRPVFCFMSEYDALPGLGHGCGHNLICAAALGAGLALARTLKAEDRKGTVVVLGTPAEESFGGKVAMLARGAMRGIDAAIMGHPLFATFPDAGCNAIIRFQVMFRGKAAHAAAAPEKGLNALDAVMLVFQAVNAWRQQLPERARIHGVVSEGGVKPNIIPDRAVCSFYLRAPTDADLRAMNARFRDIVRGAALMTGTRAKITPWLTPYRACKPNPWLNRAFVEAAEVLELHPAANTDPGRASTDFGDVSQAMPGAHIYFGIARRHIAAHSVAFREAASKPYAFGQMLRCAEALARVGYRYITEADFRRRVQGTFKKERQA